MNGPCPVVNCVSWSAACVQHRTDAYDGLRCYYESYWYDRLEDAVNYARLRRSRTGSQARIPMAYARLQR
jgi:hypothetical protein